MGSFYRFRFRNTHKLISPDKVKVAAMAVAMALRYWVVSCRWPIFYMVVWVLGVNIHHHQHRVVAITGIITVGNKDSRVVVHH